MSISGATLPAMSHGESNEKALEQRRKELTEYLLREGLATYRNGRLSANSRGSTSSGKTHPSSVGETIQNAKGDIFPAVIDEDEDHVFNDDVPVADSEVIDDNIAGSMQADDTEATLAEVTRLILDSSSDQEGEQQDEEDVTVDFEFNTEDATVQFERALLEHRNSIGSYDGDEFIVDNSQSEPFVIADLDENAEETDSQCAEETDSQCAEETDSQCAEETDSQCAEEQINEMTEAGDSQCTLEKTDEVAESSQTDPSILAHEVSNVSSQMNAAFLASESQQISFESFPPESETSGEQGYTTGKDHLSSPGVDSSPNVSHHNESSNASDQNIEITLCSSRLEDDTASLPQPDVSPLTEEEADKDTTAPFHHDPQEGGFQESERPCLEERVPHLHYNPPKLSASNLMHDDNFVDGGTEGESDGEPEIITENVAPLNIITVDENDVETDDDILYDDDSQIGDDDDVDECDHRPASPTVTTNSCLTEPQPAVEALTTEQVDLSEEQSVKKVDKHFRVRLARRRWFDCCSLL